MSLAVRIQEEGLGRNCGTMSYTAPEAAVPTPESHWLQAVSGGRANESNFLWEAGPWAQGNALEKGQL